MRWSVFLIFAYASLLLEVGLSDVLEYRDTGASPGFLLILAVFIGMSAPPITAAWSLLILGVLADLTRHYLIGSDQVVWLIGPAALGYLVGAMVVVQMRVMMYRNSIVALAIMVLIVGSFAHLVAIALVTARGLPWIPCDPVSGWNAADELVRAFRQVVYSVIVAIPAGALLLRLAPMWAFEPLKSKGPRIFS